MHFDAMTITVVMFGKFVLFSSGKVKNFFWIRIKFYGKVKDIIFWIRIKFHLGRAKGRGKRGYGGEAQNEGHFCKIPIIQQDINFIPQTFGQTNF